MSETEKHVYSNRLISEKSPYLLQHAHNPVDWYPWGKEGFEKARNEDKMVLVSIGYATCHWCHVMERESFEDPELAEYLNDHFVAIKVDREERPDVDKIYMDALHAQKEQGGWPLNMFLTPEGMPVTGGTYFPPDNRYGRPSFRHVLETIATIWQKERERIYKSAEELTAFLRQQATLISADHVDWKWNLEINAIEYFKQSFDQQEGGFELQAQNKFPPSMGLMLLLRYHERTGDPQALAMVELTLKKMFSGGIYDQLGGGLCRYSTDYQWLVPHFEKMLYDNALFTWALIEAFQVTGDCYYRQAAEDVLNYIERDMRSSEGAFYSAEDADSEGEEGKFYVWKQDEIFEILGNELGRHACAYWRVEERGNFETGQNILHRPDPEDEVAERLGISLEMLRKNMTEARQKLLAARSQRIRPLCDDKILVSWNALMISAFARAARVFNKEHYGDIAVEAAEFILSKLRDEKGRLLRRYRQGEARFYAYLCDYAQMATACLDLYEYSYDLKWFKTAVHLMNEINVLFKNESGPYFDVGEDAEELLTRNMEGYDGVEPSGNSAAALAFLKLHAYGVSGQHYEDAQRILKGFARHLEQAGVNFAAMHWALHWFLLNPKQIVIVGDRNEAETESLLQVVRQGYYPNTVTVFVPKSDQAPVSEIIPLALAREAINGKATAYVCQNMACQLPVHTPEALKEQLAQE
ncbi:MAG: thioredoxin domain-containing protein [SAR324 cluster bacterium]|nr:thioredoxin domain-containing protein [SAR324 cluster bacterium]